MKNIKSYKIFESTETKLYDVLNPKHYDNIKEYLFNNIISMSYDNRMVINNFYNNLGASYINYASQKKPVYKWHDDTMADDNGLETNIVMMDIDNQVTNQDIAVYELIDDYFMVFILNGSYLRPYICDTIQGVVQLLSDFDKKNLEQFDTWDKQVASDLYANWMW